MNQNNKALGQIIAARRTKIGISQEELADRASIHRTYVSQIERGLKSPTLSVLLKLAASMNTSASKMLSELETHINGISDKQHI